MKGLKALVAVMVAAGLLACAVPASAGAAAYEHYVGCGDSTKTKPSHACPRNSKKGAFFRSLNADVEYKVCVKFPNRTVICTKQPHKAKEGQLYVNVITSTIPGKHRVSWFVKGKKVGSFAFRVER